MSTATNGRAREHRISRLMIDHGGEWRPAKDAPDYLVSNRGEVWSTVSERLLSPTLHPSGHWYISLRSSGARANYQIHRLVAEHFIGPSPSAQHEVCHNDGDASNNHVTNLRWDTRSANVLDQVRHGTHVQARKTHCPRDHAYDELNTYVNPQGKRECRQCHRESQARRRARRSA
jgi:hypothetical protein